MEMLNKIIEEFGNKPDFPYEEKLVSWKYDISKLQKVIDDILERTKSSNYRNPEIRTKEPVFKYEIIDVDSGTKILRITDKYWLFNIKDKIKINLNK